MRANTHEIVHPLITAKLTRMRDAGCHPQEARRLLREIGLFLSYEAARQMDDATTMHVSASATLTGNEVVICSILRAGLTMSEGIQDVFPSALMGHLGIVRHESKDSFEENDYLVALPAARNRFFVVVDFAAINGRTALSAMSILKSVQISDERIVFICVLTSEEALDLISTIHPGVHIYYAISKVTAAEAERFGESMLYGQHEKTGDKLFGTIAEP